MPIEEVGMAIGVLRKVCVRRFRIGELEELPNVVIVDGGDLRLELRDEMGECCGRPVSVEGAVAIREEEQKEAASSEDAVKFDHEPDRVGEMLEDVRTDDEVLASRGYRPELVYIEIRDEVRYREVCAFRELRVQVPVLVGRPPVDVQRGGPVGKGHGLMAGAEFKAASP